MAFQFRFDRMMQINESEKKLLEQQYNEIYQQLERQGKRLIALMERKENVQNQFENQKRVKMTIADVMSQTQLLSSISEHLKEEQSRYNQIRTRVEHFHQKLLDKSIEIKKFEKLKDVQRQQYDRIERQKENQLMDEKAAINYLRH
ncbi:flagellar FliJ protein [Pullulanibacillus camelliae]|uniref:Flagellar FliJ protein n=1 Tax=Pullulanibacillus camelliae TaxID=1707096 RepID=A0A8J2VP37_9BACL|nr:flagellar FliJ family protein [Pullulanibacillus camelliae]GGE42138.1 flagellar FliJ protein [Pullulanibacillus camelliae]